MPNYSVFDKTGKKVSDIALSDAIFAITPNASAMHLCVVAPGHSVYPYTR